jgi:hypothetical protein
MLINQLIKILLSIKNKLIDYHGYNNKWKNLLYLLMKKLLNKFYWIIINIFIINIKKLLEIIKKKYKYINLFIINIRKI